MINLVFLSHNVRGWRRFGSPNKGFAKQRPGLTKCGGRKHHKGRIARLVFSETRGREQRP